LLGAAITGKVEVGVGEGGTAMGRSVGVAVGVRGLVMEKGVVVGVADGAMPMDRCVGVGVAEGRMPMGRVAVGGTCAAGAAWAKVGTNNINTNSRLTSCNVFMSSSFFLRVFDLALSLQPAADIARDSMLILC
jgi:hypothetical protein